MHSSPAAQAEEEYCGQEAEEDGGYGEGAVPVRSERSRRRFEIRLRNEGAQRVHVSPEVDVGPEEAAVVDAYDAAQVIDERGPARARSRAHRVLDERARRLAARPPFALLEFLG